MRLQINRVKNLTVDLPMGFGITFELSGEDPVPRVSAAVALDPDRAVYVAKEVQGAVTRGDLTEATQRLVALAREFKSSDRQKARLISARTNSLILDRDHGDISHSSFMTQRAELFGSILETAEQYERLARLQGGRYTERLNSATGQLPLPMFDQESSEQSTDDGLGATIVVQDASVFFGSSCVLSKVNLIAWPGKIYGVVGRNGSGKTTLLRAMAGGVSLRTGSVSYPIKALPGVTWEDIRERRYYMPQVLRHRSGDVDTILRLYASFRGIVEVANDEEVDWTLEQFELTPFRFSEWSALPVGYKARFEIALALLGYPSILLLDEPLAALDVISRWKVLKTLRDLADSARPATIVISSHDIQALEDIVDDIIILSNGSPLYAGPKVGLQGPSNVRVYEIICGSGSPKLTDVLSDIDVLTLTKVGDRSRVTVPANVTQREILEAILAADGSILYFRDLSNSAERAFEDDG